MILKMVRLAFAFVTALAISAAFAADGGASPKNPSESKRSAGKDLPCAEDPPAKTELKKKSTTKKEPAAAVTPAKP